ncbi:hypothetical protein L1987_01594 [Smallanthus sonchifolius]|uniref:Uncharacterized protein n=1 Tax=Smallanthus sonchifolius TaxID=185202 RepID=A0ACB9K5J1_9ASTR|nr:hypothetical protein L1987_01594 [Smallanthus sonchifolius]
MRLREDSTSHNSDAKTENEDMVTGKTDTIEEGANSIEVIVDGNGEEPLQKACENMHLDTIGYLLKAVNEDAKTELQSSLAGSDDDIGVHLLVNAISAKQYSLASELLMRFPKSASKRDDVLMAIAKTYPSELDYAEKLIYPSPFRSAFAFLVILGSFIDLQSDIANFIHGFFRVRGVIAMRIISVLIFFMFCAVPVMLALPFLTAYLSIVFLYFLCWKGAKMLDYWPLQAYSIKEQVQHHNFNESFNGVRK